MEDLKLIISQNIVELRHRSGMKQIELAEKLNYSDKAISKWERGESIPDVTVLKQIADIFGVTVDYLLTSDHNEEELSESEGAKVKDRVIESIKRRRRMVTGMSILLVWVIATLLFVIFSVALPQTDYWLVYIYAVVASMIVWLIFNSIWHNQRNNYLIISLLMWSLIATLFITFLTGGFNVWQMFLIGIPGQMIIILWSVIGRKK